MMFKNVIVTGGAGFIGSALIRYLLSEYKLNILNIDKLTYAGNESTISNFVNFDNYFFSQTDICEKDKIHRLISEFKPDLIIHLAAESHVDRSIDESYDFIRTNIEGTYTLLQSSKDYWEKLQPEKKKDFRFLHVSTDEVYGDLPINDPPFTENSRYRPSSPYAASKASSDHFVRSWYRTYGFPILITNCSNNYGPYQFPEKLIPNVILSALSHRKIPVYGTGNQLRDWLYVEDHVRAIFTVACKAEPGETLNIGGNHELSNIEVVRFICDFLDLEIRDKPKNLKSFSQLITFVDDRPGHDFRYSINSSNIQNKYNWSSNIPFDIGIKKTINWYIENSHWWKPIVEKKYNLSRLGKLKNL